MITIKSKEEIEKMRVAGQVVASALTEIAASIVPGKTTTLDLDNMAEMILAREGAISSFKGYRGYPCVVCIAVNEEVVHGIPGPRRLEEGDIVGIDLGAIVDGYHGDSAISVPVGEVTPEAKKLLKVTREALFAGIKMAKAGNRLSDISNAIQQYAEKHHFSVVRDLVGHGIGREMHEEPQIPNFGRPGRGPVLQEGMTLAIEPMVNAGGYQVESLWDRWTIVTQDKSLSAHFEHTVAVTKKGPDILTIRSGETIP
ncbi:MAG: type I methionyl aminopeptidase [Armatimonadota bacterium]